VIVGDDVFESGRSACWRFALTAARRRSTGSAPSRSSWASCRSSVLSR
jgi:hypothetical protein